MYFKSFLRNYNCMNKNGDFDGREGWVSSSSLSFKGTCNKNGSLFDKVKRVLYVIDFS